jgi:TolB-like protein
MINSKINNITKYLQLLCHSAMVIGLILLIGACSKRYSDLPSFAAYPIKDYPNESVGRFKTSYLAEQFDTFYRGTNPGPIGVTTFVNLDDLYTTSSFGRMLSEQVMSELTMRGYDVIELRHTNALQFLSSAGEFAMSRENGFVRKERELGGIVVGTYVASPERVYLNARLLDPASSKILTAGSVEMEKTDEIAKLLKTGSVKTALERIPVKHIGFSSYPMNLMPNNEERVHEIEDQGGITPQAPLPRLK